MSDTRLITEQDVFLDVDATTKEELFSFISEQAVRLGVTDDAEGLAADLMDREQQISTGLTDGFAIPHTKSARVKHVEVFYLRTRSPIPWETMDSDEAGYFFALLVPEENKGNIHLQMISALAVSLLEDDFKETVKSCSDQVLLGRHRAHRLHRGARPARRAGLARREKNMKVVGVSACPAGLAHTPMAAKALMKAGEKMGWDVKMEQQSAMGTINRVTREEAQAADFVLIASDQKIKEMERFDGRPTIRVDINMCIKAPEAVLKKCGAAVEAKKQ